MDGGGGRSHAGGQRGGAVRARLRIGVLISGRGSNLQALIDAAADPAYPAEIVLVISNRAEAQGLRRAGGARVADQVVAGRGPTPFPPAATGSRPAKGVRTIPPAGFLRPPPSRFFR